MTRAPSGIMSALWAWQHLKALGMGRLGFNEMERAAIQLELRTRGGQQETATP